MVTLANCSLRAAMLVACSTLTAAINAGCLAGYQAQRMAPQELVVRQQFLGYEFWTAAGKKPVSDARNAYIGLEPFVRCVPDAREHAASARRGHLGAYTLWGLAAVTAVTATTLAVVNPNLPEPGGPTLHEFPYSYILLGGIAAGTASILSTMLKNHADGHAIDAMNLYNDRVGSLGAGCDGRDYAPPILVPAAPRGRAEPTGPVQERGAPAQDRREPVPDTKPAAQDSGPPLQDIR